MKKIEAIIKPFKLEEVKAVLTDLGILGMTVIEVQGYQSSQDRSDVFRGGDYLVDFLPKIKIELVLDDARADKAVDAIVQSARTGKVGDGKIFVTQVEEVVRIRTNERAFAAL